VGANAFSLQLNSSFFTSTTACSGAAYPATCKGWEQFVHSNLAAQCAFIQYWLIAYNAPCPIGWLTSGPQPNGGVGPRPGDLESRQPGFDGASGCGRHGHAHRVEAIRSTRCRTWTTCSIWRQPGRPPSSISSATVAGPPPTSTPDRRLLLGPGWPPGSRPHPRALAHRRDEQSLFPAVLGYAPIEHAAGDRIHAKQRHAPDLALQFRSRRPGRKQSRRHPRFKGDGFSDIVWSDSNGNIAVWLMNGTQVELSGTAGTAPTTWSIVGQRDFNGDGTYDLLWLDTSGDLSIWFMIGTQVFSSAAVGNVGTTWSVAGTADFNKDGKGDILWRDSSGNTAIWLMNGASPYLPTASLGNIPTNFSVVGTGDFNGDGFADILFQDGSGNYSIWFMTGTAESSPSTSVLSSAAIGNISTNWTVVGTGDFNGDGMTDIVWRDNSGNTSIWLMDGASILISAGIGNVPTNWSLELTGDFNGDGKSDLLWRDNVGNTAIWFMNATTVWSSQSVAYVPTNWIVVNANAE
jgi:hypothetical protein